MNSERKRRKAAPNGNPEITFLEPGRGLPAPREVFLVLPGLNLAPEKMEPLARFLVEQGYAVALLFPEGFFPAKGLAGALVGLEGWLERLDRYQVGVNARFPGARLSLLAFSMGGLLGLVWSLRRGVPLHRAILVAPAFSLKKYGRPLLRLLTAVAPRHWLINSFSPAPYRLRRGTSVAAYAGLLQLERLFHQEIKARMADGGTGALPHQFIAFAPRDELVSTRYYSGYRHTLGGRVSLYPIAHRPRLGYPRHLTLDGFTLGAKQWETLCAALAQWLQRMPVVEFPRAKTDKGAK